MADFWVRLAKKNSTRASRILKKVVFGSPVAEFADSPPLQAFSFYIPRAESYKKNTHTPVVAPLHILLFNILFLC